MKDSVYEFPSNIEGAKGGVAGTSAAHGKAAEGSTMGEGDREAEARVSTQWVTSAGVVRRVPLGLRIAMREVCEVPAGPACHLRSNWMTYRCFLMKRRMSIRP